jgi:hypothetical protein
MINKSNRISNLSGEGLELVEVLDVQADDVNIGMLVSNFAQLFCLK